jgi:hypothetical protein
VEARILPQNKNIYSENDHVNVALSVLNAIAKMGSIVFLPSVNRSNTPKLDSKINLLCSALKLTFFRYAGLPRQA